MLTANKKKMNQLTTQYPVAYPKNIKKDMIKLEIIFIGKYANTMEY